MPNWFYFTLEVTGKEKDVQEFVQNVKGSKEFETEGSRFDFNHFIPQPKEIFRGDLGMEKLAELREQGVPDWYDWNVHNWGTKWNAHCDFMDSDKTHAFYRIETAWAFPSPVIEVMLSMYPNLCFEIEGEEETQSYGVYIKQDKSRLITWAEEEPGLVDELNDKEVCWDSESHLWYYLDDSEVLKDQEDFYPTAKYSWS